jgi:hypothetical protein
VFWDKKSRRWRCQLGFKNKKIFLGYFGVAEDAARAYDHKLVELHGGSGWALNLCSAMGVISLGGQRHCGRGGRVYM